MTTISEEDDKFFANIGKDKMKSCIICRKIITHNYRGQRTCGDNECQFEYEKLKDRIWHKANKKLKENHRVEFLSIFKSLLDKKQNQENEKYKRIRI